MKPTVTKRIQTKSVARRAQSKTQLDCWNLNDLLKSPQADFDRITTELDAMIFSLESWRSRLSPEMATKQFTSLVRLSEQIASTSTTVGAHSYLWFSEDTTNQKARAFKNTVEERLTGLQNRMLFFDLWWQGVDDTHAARLMDASGDVRYHLESIRRLKPHTLSEPEEKIINVKNVTGRGAMHTLYDVLTNELTFTLTVDGKKKSLTREGLMSYLRSPSARVREATYKELYRVFTGHSNVIGEIYSTLIHDWRTENIELRKFSTPIAPRNLGNDVPDQAVNALLSACTKNASIFQEYFKLKARICKLGKLSRYHIYAPHRSDRKRYRYQDAKTMVLEAYRGFSPHMGELAARVFDEQHIDAPARPGKLSGAYCYSVAPGLTPYIMLNYTGEARDIATLAHELGHAIHGMMAGHHSIFTFHSTLPLAETASVFGERILSDALMAQERNTAVKQGLLLSQLDDIYATVLRQAYFVQFENTAHELIGRGGTAQDLTAAYLANLRQQFGKAVTVPDEFQWEWMTIPHIFASPFYCYAYSFGNLLVLALYRMYKEQGQSFVPKYLDLLAAGGSKSPAAILSTVGVDMNSEAFWQSGFDTIREMVQELDRTMD
jgi:oligoendopeptidase F